MRNRGFSASSERSCLSWSCLVSRWADTARAAEQTDSGGLAGDRGVQRQACEILGAHLTPDTACISFGTIATINTHNAKYVEVKRLMPPFLGGAHHYYSEIGALRGF
jgi:hypothetical protein